MSVVLASAKDGAFEPPPIGHWWLRPTALFDGERLHHSMALRIESGRVREVTDVFAPVADGAPCWYSDCLACPTFLDLQVNGGGGILFNNDPTPEALAAIGAAHRKGGTGAWFPTLLSTTAEVMTRAVDAVLATHGHHGVMGMHLEGPHISPEYRGAHSLEHVRPLDEHTWRLLHRLRARDIPVILTLAPERVPRGAVAELVAMGVTVSIGHSGASEMETREALAAGASLFTHLFNEMPPLRDKQIGLAGVALDCPAYCGVIADGRHVADAMLRLAVRAKRRPNALFAVTDAMPTVHGPPTFTLYGETLRLREGRLIDSRGSLAGVHIDMIGTLRRLVHEVGLPLETALAMVTSTPARAAGLQGEHGVLAMNGPANLLLLDPEVLQIRHMLIKGIPAPRTDQAFVVSSSLCADHTQYQ